jgi:tetratricopeptide (TPR) repeat protein
MTNILRHVKNILIGAAVLVALLALLSATLLNKQSGLMRMTSLMREGRLAMEMRDYGEAIDVYRLAISLNEGNAKAYLALAEACRLDGDDQEALYYLKLGMKKTGSAKIREAHEELLGKITLYDPDVLSGA